MLDRRKFISYLPASLASLGLFAATRSNEAFASNKKKSVGAIETLSRGHGVFLRALIIYDVTSSRATKGERIDPTLVQKTTEVIHQYLNVFHEPMEEQYIFYPLEKKDVCFASIQELKLQHGISYELTKRITQMTKEGKFDQVVMGYMSDFVKMYRHHSAWEDTVIFPAFDQIKSNSEIDEVANVINTEEKSILGNDGFDSFVKQIADVEKQLGIYELSTSTPKLA